MPKKTIHFDNPRILNSLYCANDKNLAKIEKLFEVELICREDWLSITGKKAAIDTVEILFEVLNKGRSQGITIRTSDFENIMKSVKRGEGEAMRENFNKPLVVQLKRKSIVPRTLNQKKYLLAIRELEIVIGIGPAGTGKTFLAVAAALDALFKEEVEKIILTRPAVEAGEALGFLPGDLTEKIQPYLRPLYDAMFEMIGRETSQKLVEKGAIEIAPLAYMRGRTLSNAFVILDEAQNTTPEQMMMFLTRMGDKSRMVVTGDITQIDLPRSKNSGLKQAIHVLKAVEGIKVFTFKGTDVVRHALVQEIIEAYQIFHSELDRGSSTRS